ncbi:hypothetical protein B0H34DRAFT_675701 [Crassisporium funariophilum]|nr:hypothetical protein B0H34DRAFT_675701 [Crassisporium funariophilum]
MLTVGFWQTWYSSVLEPSRRVEGKAGRRRGRIQVGLRKKRGHHWAVHEFLMDMWSRRRHLVPEQLNHHVHLWSIPLSLRRAVKLESKIEGNEAFFGQRRRSAELHSVSLNVTLISELSMSALGSDSMVATRTGNVSFVGQANPLVLMAFGSCFHPKLCPSYSGPLQVIHHASLATEIHVDHLDAIQLTDNVVPTFMSLGSIAQDAAADVSHNDYHGSARGGLVSDNGLHARWPAVIEANELEQKVEIHGSQTDGLESNGSDTKDDSDGRAMSVSWVHVDAVEVVRDVRPI